MMCTHRRTQTEREMVPTTFATKATASEHYYYDKNISVPSHYRRNLGGGVFSTPIFEISTSTCIHVNLNLNTHYSLYIKKTEFYCINISIYYLNNGGESSSFVPLDLEINNSDS
jgi:hypothetical protein